jgi:transcriptional regulator with XRE-family HTH domain
MNTIGKRLHVAREKAKLTIPEVSEKSNISIGNLSKLENDVNKPSANALISLSNIYEVSIDWILKGHCNGESPPATDQMLIPDKEIMNLFNQLARLWHEADRDLQGWTKIQLKRAFSEIAAELKAVDQPRATRLNFLTVSPVKKKC